jgi:hypothetical protein
MVGVFLVIMAYAVAFFGVGWPDRVVKARLFKWLMRGPVTASFTLAVVTLLRRASAALGYSENALVPIAMVGTILILEYLITIFAPLGERVLFSGNDRRELEVLRRLENRLVTRNDLKQFLELVLASAIDHVQAEGAYLVAISPNESELVVTSGKTRFETGDGEAAIPTDVLPEAKAGSAIRVFHWGNDLLLPLYNGVEGEPELIGILGISRPRSSAQEGEMTDTLALLADRAAMALRDRRIQEKIFSSLEDLAPKVDLLQRMRAAGQYDQGGLFADDSHKAEDMSVWVREALTHYWGGPKLTNSPLLRYQVVQDVLKEYDGNQSNALRAILRRGIDQIRPVGERRFTAEWILYNILEMKFVEGRKVREIAMRLAMSEADLYRKQRVAIEAVAKAVDEMETKARGVSSG